MRPWGLLRVGVEVNFQLVARLLVPLPLRWEHCLEVVHGGIRSSIAEVNSWRVSRVSTSPWRQNQKLGLKGFRFLVHVKEDTVIV